MTSKSSAILSADGRYRYTLVRNLDTGLLTRGGTDRPCLFVMLNPSTADHTTDDQTVRQCMYFATREMCTSLQIVNLYAYRTAYPKVLEEARRDGTDIIGPETDAYIKIVRNRVHQGDGIVIAAWGAHKPSYPDHRNSHAARIQAVREMLDTTWWCLGTTADGSPRHPSRLAHDTPITPWSPR